MHVLGVRWVVWGEGKYWIEVCGHRRSVSANEYGRVTVQPSAGAKGIVGG